MLSAYSSDNSPPAGYRARLVSLEKTMKHLLTSCLAALLFVATTAGAQTPDNDPRLSLQLHWNFGGSAPAQPLRYALQVLQPEHALQAPAVALLALQGSTHGLYSARLGGVELRRGITALNAEGEAVPAAEAPESGGLFADIGLGLGTVLVGAGIAAALVLASTSADDRDYFENNNNDGNDTECSLGNVDVIGPCSPIPTQP